MTDEPKRMMKLDTDGTPITECTITPIPQDGPTAPKLPAEYAHGQEHWSEAEARKKREIIAMAQKLGHEIGLKTFTVDALHAILTTLTRGS